MIAVSHRGGVLGGDATRTPRRRPAIAKLARRAVPGLLAIAAVGGLVLAVDPRSIAGATAGFDRRAVLPVFGLTVVFYGLQGLRWHLLLRHVGVRQRVSDSELMNLAGQAVTAVLPLGDLTRALLASEVSGVGFGATAATVTVQELSFTLVVVLAAAPGLVLLPGGLLWMSAAILGVLGIVALLVVEPVYAVVRRAVGATPGLRRLGDQVDELQHGVRSLLVRPEVLAGAFLDVARAAVAIAMLWLILSGLGVSLTPTQVGLVFAVSYVGGALSLLPGGIGANEASVVGILAVLGVGPGAAAAAALLQRVALFGVASLGGLLAYTAIRRRRRGDTPGALAEEIPSALAA